MFGRRVKVTRETAAASATVTRSDIPCGLQDCTVCAANAAPDIAPVLASDRIVLVPTAAALSAYIDIFDEPTVDNLLLLSTELARVAQINRAAHARLLRLTADRRRRAYAFANDRHRTASVEKKGHEADDEFSMRAVAATVSWVVAHNPQLPPVSVRPVGEAADNNKTTVDAEDATAAAPPAGTPATTARFRIVVLRDDERDRWQRLQGAAPGSSQLPPPSDVIIATLREVLDEILGAGHPLTDRLNAIEENPRGGGAGGGGGPSASVEPHWSGEMLQSALAAGGLVRGKFRASEGSHNFGEVRGKFGAVGERVLLAGRGAVNRAIHDDVVAVQVDPVEKWRGPTRNGPPPPDGADAAAAVRAGYTATGRVVGILEKYRRPYCGSIDVTDGETAAGLSGTVSVLFRPKTSRVPRIRISTQQAASLKSKRLRVVIDDWPITSAFPHGHYTDVIGDIGDKDTEAKVILLENDIPHYDFSEEVYDCLPKGTWEVEASEVAKRKDLRHLNVCSVDPLGCRDIDDALHYRELPNGNAEVGVHIADVSHFVLENTPIDLEAAKRSTSVYLVDRRINMLPQLLTENLCSIVGNEDRYAFSVLWEIDSDCQVVSEWFGKTIIRSRAALYYGDAQKMIDDTSDTSDLSNSLRGLMRLSRILHRRRDEAGALTLGSQEFKFKIDNDHVNPTDMMQYQTFETNSMVEEWMLFANVAAARWCYKHFPSHAMLRRHPTPSDRACDDLNAALKARGLPLLDVSTSKALNNSLNRCLDSNDPFINRLVRILTTRCLKQAQYFCSGDLSYEEFLHFGLAMPIYTHFTSPIRRYADVVVHRQLAAITGFGDFSVERTTSEQVAALAENINYRHEMAQKAGRDSQNLFTGFFLRKYPEGGIPIENGYVVKVTDTFVSVMVPSFGQEGRVPIETLSRAATDFRPLDKVRVKMTLVREGDLLSAKLAYRIVESEADGRAPRAADAAAAVDDADDAQQQQQVVKSHRPERESAAIAAA